MNQLKISLNLDFLLNVCIIKLIKKYIWYISAQINSYQYMIRGLKYEYSQLDQAGWFAFEKRTSLEFSEY